MQKGEYLNIILKSDKDIFTIKDIVLLWQDSDINAVRVRLSFYVRKKYLYRIRKGIYAKDKDYNKLELATRIFTPSYVSFETVLAKEGLIFQYHNKITVASYLSRDITVDEQVYSYNKIKDTALLNPNGIIQENNTCIASKERAFLDTLYINTDFHFDNLRSLDWELVFALLPIYENKNLVAKVNRIFNDTKHFNT